LLLIYLIDINESNDKQSNSKEKTGRLTY